MHIVDSMEITKVFKACVKAARAKNKDLSSPSDILKPFRKKDDSSFNNKLLDVVRNITKLRDFLLKHRKDYLGNNYIVMSSTMTNEERDQIDNDAQVFMKSCYAAIGGMRKEASTFKDSSQFQEHVSVVLELVDVYLKDICKLYSQQRAFRVKQAVDKKRLLRLCPEGKREATNNDASASQGARINATTYKKEVKTSEIRERETRSPLSEIDSLEEDSDEPLGTSESSPTSEKPRNESVTSNQQSSDIHLEDSKKPEAAVLSKEEMQLFEEENETLYAEMNNLVDEVRQIEGKVIEISQLQEIFQEKIIEQSAQIEGINETAVGTVENVKEGNEQIREAIKNSATFRVWILFFLVMCTLSLLFLDWYNS